METGNQRILRTINDMVKENTLIVFKVSGYMSKGEMKSKTHIIIKDTLEKSVQLGDFVVITPSEKLLDEMCEMFSSLKNHRDKERLSDGNLP